jgi:hypothetical protein
MLKTLNEKELATILKSSVAKLRRDRWLGRGIPYLKNGRSVRYLETDILKFIEDNRVEARSEHLKMEKIEK